MRRGTRDGEGAGKYYLLFFRTLPPSIIIFTFNSSLHSSSYDSYAKCT